MNNNRAPKELLLLSAQPHDVYFQWQIEVQITNFREFGLSDQMHVLVWYPTEGCHPGWKEVMEKYPEVRFYFYKDQGVDLALYIPQLRPHILKMHFLQYPQLRQRPVFYHDSDIIFNYLPNFEQLIDGPICYTSDTCSYLDYTYLRTKEQQGNIPEEEVIKTLEERCGLEPGIIKAYDRNAGGAQYVLKNLDTDFWRNVERDCLIIRTYLMKEVNTKYFESENAGFQSWCADMWAVNFNLWKRGQVTQITQELDFSWATDSLETFYKKPIFHNAGAVSGAPDLFYKGSWINRSPLGKGLQVAEKYASWAYVNAINRVPA